MTFRVLFVCTGNICRSPMAERLLLARVSAVSGAEIQAASVGTRAMVGYGMDLAGAHVVREHGGSADGHVARQIEPATVQKVDLVLAATVAHRDAVIRMVPAAMRRTFTLREFGRLGAGLGPASGEHPAKRVLEVAAQRGVVPPPDPGADDIGDPYGAPVAVMRACGQEISDAVDAVIRVLGIG